MLGHGIGATPKSSARASYCEISAARRRPACNATGFLLDLFLCFAMGLNHSMAGLGRSRVSTTLTGRYLNQAPFRRRNVSTLLTARSPDLSRVMRSPHRLSATFTCS